jgi:hypothetical protein
LNSSFQEFRKWDHLRGRRLVTGIEITAFDYRQIPDIHVQPIMEGLMAGH